MKIRILMVGATTTPWVSQGMQQYAERLTRMAPVEMVAIPDIRASRSTTPERQKELEGERILAAVGPGEPLVLLDERGREYTSRELAGWLEQRMATGATKALNLVIGGPYGFSQAVYDRANGRIALSRLTFTHEMARLLLTEQIYRALSIIRGLPYHHD